MADLYFSQIREDGQAERKVLASIRKERVACIGSGGCTVFSLLDDDIEEVVVADANPAQCALIELKVAAVRELDRDQFMAFIGERPTTRRGSTYAALRSQLSDDVKRYWDNRIDWVAAGINKIGVTERYYDFVGRNIRSSVISMDVLEALFECSCMEKQMFLYEEHFKNERWEVAMRLLLSKQTNLLFYPAFWYAHVTEREFENLLMPLLTAELTSRPASKNYFLSQLFLGRYLDPDCDGAPHYLSAPGYAAAQRNLDKLRIENLPIQDVLVDEREIGAFFLSNIFDWGKPANAQAVWDAVLQAAATGATFLFRNMYRQTSIPVSMLDNITVDQIASWEFTKRERSMLYRHIQTGTIH